MRFEDVLGDVSVDRAWEHLEHITTAIPSRLAGSENSRRMAEYAHEVFERNALTSEMHEFRGLVSFPEPAQVRVTTPDEYQIEANTLGHSASTSGVEGELVYVGSGAESDYEGKDVRGKITLSELSYSPARHEKAFIAWKRGSIAQIMMNWGPPDNQAVPFGSMKSAWGNPDPQALETEIPDLPCVGIARVDGLRLKEACESGTVRVWLTAEAENAWKPVTMTTAETGTNVFDEFMLIGGHMDSWFGPQATDNAAGNACIMELARVFAPYSAELRRGLVAGLWMGHETGTMISSTRFADTNWDRLRAGCVGYLQIDQPAMTGTSTWHVHSTDDIQAYATRITKETFPNTPLRWHRQQKNGDSSFFGVGLACLAAEMSFTEQEIQETALASLGWWHHSIHNTIDKVSKKRLADHLRLYARWVWDLLTETVLPYEYEPLSARFVDRLGTLASSGDHGIDILAVLDEARAFQTQAAHFDSLAAHWRSVDSAGDESSSIAPLINRTMLQLSRILVPVASTVVGPYGQDRYGHAWQTQMIPSLMAYASLDKYERSSEAYETWWVAAVRARNRTMDALREANRVIGATLQSLDN